MKIRAITVGENIPFFNKNVNIDNYLEDKLYIFSNLCSELIDEFEKSNIQVETRRFCSQPIFNGVKCGKSLNDDMIFLEQQISDLRLSCKKHGFDYFACCAAVIDGQISFEDLEILLSINLPNFLKKWDNFFSSLNVASTKNGIDLTALKLSAKIIKNLAEPDPFNNLKFCLSSNVEPDTPFFPSAYHSSKKPIFSVALESADEVVNVFEKAKGLTDAKINLKSKFSEIYELITNIAEKIGNKFNIDFNGIDFSPAPYPTLERSIGTAIEKLNFEYFGVSGSLIGVALIKNCIPKKEKVIGFSGFMQPVLEDFTIAKRAAENKLNLESLLLYSTICGTGLDCVPLPGDITERELFYILLDVCIISLTHDKPLTARLMPIHGKNAGDDVEFDFEYFAKSKVMNIKRLTKSKKDDLFNRNEKHFHLF